MKPHLVAPSPLGRPGLGPGSVELSATPLAPLPLHQAMVFPGLGLNHEAFLTTAEFGTQELGRPVQMRLQVYRPIGEAGGTPSWWWELGDLGVLSMLSCLLISWPLDWSPALGWTG